MFLQVSYDIHSSEQAWLKRSNKYKGVALSCFICTKKVILLPTRISFYKCTARFPFVNCHMSAAGALEKSPHLHLWAILDVHCSSYNLLIVKGVSNGSTLLKMPR